MPRSLGAGNGRGRLRAMLAVAVACAIALAGATAVHTGTAVPRPGALELHNAQLSRTAATQGMVLLENYGHALPIAKSGNIALFGVGAYKTVSGGTGSGIVHNRYSISVRTGFENAGYHVTTSSAYWDAMVSAYDKKYGGKADGRFGYAVDYASIEQPLAVGSVQPSAATETAVYVLSRTSGEGADRSAGPGDYQLGRTENDDIKLIGQSYQRVIVVLNVGGIVDTSFYRQINASTRDPNGDRPIDSLLLMGQAGQESGSAVTDVLNATVPPSGKLTDTWASDYRYYPASATFARNDGNSHTEQYSEGIYVGYRYFDSFYDRIDAAHPSSVVNYPFGYGLSYTNFVIKPLTVSADIHSIAVRTRVTNVGSSFSGKDVVEVYASAPQTGLDKPYQQLVGYAKTDNLAPHASQVVTIRFRTTDLASYDTAAAAYVLDAGDYVIRVGDCSRTTHVAAKIRLPHRLTTRQVANELGEQEPASELSSDPTGFYRYAAEKTELAHAPARTLRTTGFVTQHDVSPYEQTNLEAPAPTRRKPERRYGEF